MHLPSFFQRDKDIVVTIHGFGQKTDKEMAPLARYLKHQGFEPVTFAYYNPQDLEDVDVPTWIERCESQLKKALATGRKVWLLGFSMGGVIASYLASVYDVQGLILAAPAFYPMDFSKVEQAAVGKLKSSSENSKAMASVQTKSFLDLVGRYRASIEAVDCPILIIHGDEDEVIQPKSSKKAFDQIGHDHKQLVYLHGAKHRFLYDGPFESLAFALINDFLRKEIQNPSPFHIEQN